MTRTRATRDRLAREGAISAARDDLIGRLGNLADLSRRPWDDVRNIEIFPGVRLGDPKIILPKDWMPSGPSERASFRTLDPALRGAAQVGSSTAIATRDESIRRSMLALWLPRRTQTGIRVLTSTSWAGSVRLLLRAVKLQMKIKPSEDGRIWSHLDQSDLLAIEAAITRNNRTKDDLRALVSILADAGMRGILSDFPGALLAEGSPEHPAGPTEEIGYQGTAAPAELEKNKERNWQPFSDIFVTELIGRALWMQDNLAKPLLECWKGLRRTAELARSRGRSTSHPSVIQQRNDFIAAFDWRDASGQRIYELPFGVRDSDAENCNLSTSWPPKNARGINVAVGCLQQMNLCLVALCTGARASEIADANDTSLGALEDGRFRARTFKLSQERTGELRDWPLHPRAIQALDLQVQIARECRPAGETHLWCKVSRGGGKLLSLTEALVDAVEYLGLEHLTGADRAHMHRWRHTVAKLVALSVVSAPQVLLDLFGHRDLEMTLRYMLSDPEIAQEAMEVAKETAYVLATEAITEASNDQAGGPAAAPLKLGVEQLKMRRGEEVYGAESLREVADILTYNGRTCNLVRPGVLCTKTIDQFGPCTQGRGQPDPGSCRTSCAHRLELQRARKHCEEALLSLLEERAAAHAEGAEMLVANFDGQIISQLRRWPDIRERIIAQDRVARSLWEDSLAAA